MFDITKHCLDLVRATCMGLPAIVPSLYYEWKGARFFLWLARQPKGVAGEYFGKLVDVV